MAIPTTKSPDAILNELGISVPDEIRLEAIAAYCGATVIYDVLDGCEAQILGHGDRAIITVNNASPRPRQRFSIAHELGHWMHDRGRVAFACTESKLLHEWDNLNPERRANRYAAELLLPSFLFIPRAKKQPVTFATVRQLARTFESSLTATAIRFVELGGYPSVVVCTDRTGRRWFAASPIVPRALWPSKILGRGTLAAQLLAGMKVCEPQLVDSNEWVSHRDAYRYCIHEDSIMYHQDTVITLLWWKDESQLLDLTED